MHSLAQIRTFFNIPQSAMAFILKVSRSQVAMAETRQRHVKNVTDTSVYTLWKAMTEATENISGKQNDVLLYKPDPKLIKNIETEITYRILICRRRLNELHKKIEKQITRDAAIEILGKQELSDDLQRILRVISLPGGQLNKLKQQAFKEEIELKALEAKLAFISGIGS